MNIETYKSALKQGHRNYQMRLLKGKKPTLEVLDDILPQAKGLSMVALGTVQVPIDLIVGTRYEGRSGSFSSNFMPLLDDHSEFANKWITLSKSLEEEGLRDPIKCTEYMGKYYVEEGNKRVSVMKYYEAVSIPAQVTRLMPPRTEEKENKLYYEYVDFYRYSRVNYISFSKLGSYARLQAAMGKDPEEFWTDDDRLDFSSVFARFTAAYEANGGSKLSITVGDAFLAFITLYGYHTTDEHSAADLKKMISKAWEEFKMLQHEDEIEVKLDPIVEKKPLISRLLPGKSELKIAFIYEKTAQDSAWTYSHELGRMHLDQTFPEEVTTTYYENITAANIEETLQTAIEDGCNIIFTTTPAFAQVSAKVAIAHPDVRILNCSLNTSHRYIRTYYSRMYEAKFLMGAIAGAMAENNKILYIADYPLFGTICHINAFALGARMVNPRAEIYLEWSTQKGIDLNKRISEIGPECISGKDMVIPSQENRFYGLYHVEKDGRSRRLAMPLGHWGKFYEQLIRTIMNGTWKHDETTKAINYWWGMSADVVDVICSKNLPIGTKRLIEILKNTIASGQFNLFSGELVAQNGVKVQTDPNRDMTAEEVIEMDWLAENVIGKIPTMDELNDQARPAISQQGVGKAKVN